MPLAPSATTSLWPLWSTDEHVDEMRVALWADNVLDPVMSGMGQHQRGFLRGLVRIDDDDLDLVVFYTRRRPRQQFPVALDRIETRALPGLRHLWYPAWHATQRPRIDRLVGKPDLMHLLHTSVTVPARAPRIAWVVDLASARYPEAFPGRRRRFKDMAIRRLAADPDVTFVTNTEFVRRELCELYDVGPDRATPVALGIDHDRFRPVADEAELERVRSTHNLPPDYALFVGLLSPRKNVDMLIEGFRIHREQVGTDLRLVLAGAPGWDYEHIYRAAEGVAGVTFLGYVPDRDLPAVYSMARCLVFPSSSEGFGMPLIEAMACGTPVVASAVTAIPEVVGDAALLLDRLDREAIASALNRVTTEPTVAADLTRRGLEQASRYTWKRAAEQCVTLYREGLG